MATFITFVMLSTLSRINSDVITCSINTPCRQTTKTCQPDEDCVINCIGDEDCPPLQSCGPCDSATFHCAHGFDCRLTCFGSHSCSSSTIYCPDGSGCNINITNGGTYGMGMGSGDIIGGIDGDVSVFIGQEYGFWNNAILNATNSAHLNLRIAHVSTLYASKIYCPQTMSSGPQNNCIVYGSGALGLFHAATFYAVESFVDINITCDWIQHPEHDVISQCYGCQSDNCKPNLYCGLANDSSHCIMELVPNTTNIWKCSDDSSVCQRWTFAPTQSPTSPTMNPTSDPTVDPTLFPTDFTMNPTVAPTFFPTSDPTFPEKRIDLTTTITTDEPIASSFMQTEGYLIIYQDDSKLLWIIIALLIALLGVVVIIFIVCCFSNNKRPKKYTQPGSSASGQKQGEPLTQITDQNAQNVVEMMDLAKNVSVYPPVPDSPPQLPITESEALYVVPHGVTRYKTNALDEGKKVIVTPGDSDSD